ncbi:MAG: glutamate-5-semialdehyde dehydrogenase [Candidatus Omnitrophica bacterium]|nr:glutamate-5-semialdehyde dehydrogenase [Candidatus Omnitrophota bacterium]
MSLKSELITIASQAQEAFRVSQDLSPDVKNRILTEMSVALIQQKSLIIKANAVDLKKARSMSLSPAFVDRLTLNDNRIGEMAESLSQIAQLPDPVGEVISGWRRPNGLWIEKVRVPIGVIAIIYESRPNVTSDCAGLCFKSGNSVILRGGKESLNSNIAIYEILKAVLKKFKIHPGMVNLIATDDHKAVNELLQLNDYIDLVIPRGGEGLIRKVTESSRIPVIKHYKGICHVYVDKDARIPMAEEVCFNAKVQRPGTCNAMECMLVHKNIAKKFLPHMLERFRKAGVQIRGSSDVKKIFKDVILAEEKDYYTEYLDLILSVKVVDDLESAINHINSYGTHHSDSIITEHHETALRFLRFVDSACVYVNASTRFTDGYQFGLGAEIGISTDKLHARGPMALQELTTYKYIVFGNGQIRT